MKTYNNGCECIQYDCGCCQHLEWDAVSMEGKCEYIIVVFTTTIM